MAQLTKQAVDEIVRDMNAFYQPDNEACGKSTPAQMKLLVERLSDYTNQVKQAASQNGLLTEYLDPYTGEKKSLPSQFNAQFAVDMAAWDQRLNHYRRVVEQTPDDQATTEAGCELIYKQVTGPLLDGIYYEVLPGIVLNDTEKGRMAAGKGHPQTDVPTTLDGKDHPGGHSNPKPPDVITPFTLGNQVIVWEQHQKERAQEFWRDLRDAAVNLPKRAAEALAEAARPLGRDFLMPLGFALLGVTAVTVTGLVIYNRVQANRLKKELQGADRQLNPTAWQKAMRKGTKPKRQTWKVVHVEEIRDDTWLVEADMGSDGFFRGRLYPDGTVHSGTYRVTPWIEKKVLSTVRKAKKSA